MRNTARDIGAIEGRSEIAGRLLNRGESGDGALDIHSAASSNLAKPRLVNIVQPQLEPDEAQIRGIR